MLNGYTTHLMMLAAVALIVWNDWNTTGSIQQDSWPWIFGALGVSRLRAAVGRES